MKKWLIASALLMMAVLLAACSAAGSADSTDPSANPDDLQEVSGIVKEVKDDLVLISLTDGGEYMLRFSENTTWREGADTLVAAGNKVTCLVKPEPTFTTPSQGEVIEVLVNEPAD